MSFKEKQAAVTLLALALVGLHYIARAITHPPATMADALPGIIGTIIALVVVIVIAQLVLIIGTGTKEAASPADERDRLIGLLCRRNAGWIGSAGLVIVVGLAIQGHGPVMLAQTAAITLILAEAALHASRLFYYRRGL